MKSTPRGAANVMTPYEKLKSLPNAAACLKPGTSFDRSTPSPPP